jgi:very-short-patch-repair endonuclease
MFDVTWVERTLLDLSGVVPATKTGLALDDALRKRKTTLERLWQELESAGGRGTTGSSTLRQLLKLRDDRDGLLASHLETDTLRVLRDKRLPPATPQWVVKEAGQHAPRLDFAYPPYRVGVESHSYRHHGHLDAWNHDVARDNRLKLLGWVVLHYTYDDVHFDRDRVVEEIRTLLVSRGALLV